MKLINRIAVVIKAKQPFVDWINTLIKDGGNLTIDEVNEDSVLFLIPDYEELEDMEEFIKDNYLNFFEDELLAWYTDENVWPKNITHKLFQEWFNVEYHTMVADVVEEAIEWEEL